MNLTTTVEYLNGLLTEESDKVNEYSTLSISPTINQMAYNAKSHVDKDQRKAIHEMPELYPGNETNTTDESKLASIDINDNNERIQYGEILIKPAILRLYC